MRRYVLFAAAFALLAGGCAKKVPPPSPEAIAHAERCTAMLDGGYAGGAKAECHRATELAPGHPQAWADLGIALLVNGELAAAHRALERAEKLDPKRPRVHNGLGVVAFAERRYPDAERHFRRALQLDRAYADAGFNRAWNLFRWGKNREAVAQLREVVKAHPDLAYPLHFYGLLLLIDADVEGAIAALIRTVELAPDDCRAWLALGTAQYRDGRFEDAEESMKTAGALCPDDEDIQRATRAIRQRQDVPIPDAHDLRP